MKPNLWYTGRISWSWIATGMALELQTNRLTNLTLHWTLTPPVKVPFYRIQRGIRTFCGFTWTLINTIPFLQNEAGFQHDKTFTVTGWPIGAQAWWYIKGATDAGPSISTSIIYTDTFPGVPGPPIPVAPEIINLDYALIHNGNHYSFWSGSNWYAVLPYAASLRVYKRIAGVWTRMDQANEPVFPPGSFSDMDARLSSDNATFHLVAYLRAAAYPPDTIMYYTYTLATDTWTLSEAIDQNTTSMHPRGNCSISLDAADKPHVIFDAEYRVTHRADYSNRIAGAWTPRAAFFALYLALYRSYSASHDTSDTFHAITNTRGSNDLRWNSRPPGGPIGADQLIDTAVHNQRPVSLSTYTTIPHVANIDYNNTLAYHIGPAPWQSFLALWPATSAFPSIITPPQPITARYIVFRPATMKALGLHWNGIAWVSFPIADPSVVSQIAASYPSPSVISYIATITAPGAQTRFFAFIPPP